MNTQITQAVGSIAHRAALANRTLADIMSSADTIVLLDVSASMNTTDSRGNKSRMTAATSDLAKLQEKFPGRILLVTFNDEPQFVLSGIPGVADGRTNVEAALEFVKEFDYPGMRFIVISDGEPDSESGALRVAATFTQPIYTIYVGPENGDGRSFLEKLSAKTGGTSMIAARADNLIGATTSLLLESK